MAKVAPKDLFDEKTMTFGEHLEELRSCLWKALIGVGIGLVVGLAIGKQVLTIVRYPIDSALAAHGIEVVEAKTDKSAKGKIVGGTLDVEADASDDAGVTRVDLLIDGEPVATDEAAPYGFAWDTTQQKDGTHTISTRAYDAAGNFATSEPATVTVDNTGPTVALEAPTAGSPVSGTVGIRGTASDNVRVAEVAFFVDDKEIEQRPIKPKEGSWWQVWSSATKTRFHFDWPTPPGDRGAVHQVRVEVRDEAGNVTKKELAVTVDNTGWKDTKAPKVSLTKPAAAPSEQDEGPSGKADRTITTKRVNAEPVLAELRERFPNVFGALKLDDDDWWVNVAVEEKKPAAGADSTSLTNALQRGAVIEPTAQGPFMAYLKVSLVAGFVLASPWVFYQVWMFVAAGLYQHERHYVHVYLPFSIGLFLGGVLFCFLYVLPMVLNFLLTFNRWLNVAPMIRLSDWISFAIMLPVMFGVAFQLPLVMLFLERIGLFTGEDYKSKRKPAIMIIAVASMMLTPSDPGSMIAMMLPMLVLYEGGIFLVQYMRRRSPFEEEEWQT